MPDLDRLSGLTSEFAFTFRRLDFERTEENVGRVSKLATCQNHLFFKTGEPRHVAVEMASFALSV